MRARPWPLLFIALIALLHAGFFIWYQRPDWNIQWTDQEGYRRLGQVFAETGKFTRFPDARQFVPEVIRTPGYPLFVAAVYKLFGTSQLVIALGQAGVFAAICLLVFAVARRIDGARTARAAAAVTALYPPLPYFGALVLTEVWTAFLFTAGMWASIKAVRERTVGLFAVAGALLAAAALSRPAFFLFPVALAMTGTILLPLARVKPRPALSHWGVLLVVAGLTLLPWFTYNYVTLGRFTMSPAGGIGRGIWEGSWQAVWPGRLQNELTQLADTAADRQTLDTRVVELARWEQLDARPILEYVHQWSDIRRIWVEPTDSQERARARVAADAEYLRVGLDNLRQQSFPHIAKRVARGVFILWAGEIPFRYSSINQLPPFVIRACWALQAVLVAAALYGLYVLARTGRLFDAVVLGAPILYVTAVHLPLLTEARQSLPVKPLLLILATVGAFDAVHRLLPLKPQVHEREHL